MSEKVLRLLFSELTTVRIRCGACGMVYELPMANLLTSFRAGVCPSCSHDFHTGGGANPLEALHTAFRMYQAAKDKVEVEFVLVDGEE